MSRNAVRQGETEKVVTKRSGGLVTTNFSNKWQMQQSSNVSNYLASNADLNSSDAQISYGSRKKRKNSVHSKDEGSPHVVANAGLGSLEFNAESYAAKKKLL